MSLRRSKPLSIQVSSNRKYTYAITSEETESTLTVIWVVSAAFFSIVKQPVNISTDRQKLNTVLDAEHKIINMVINTNVWCKLAHLK